MPRVDEFTPIASLQSEENIKEVGEGEIERPREPAAQATQAAQCRRTRSTSSAVKMGRTC